MVNHPSETVKVKTLTTHDPQRIPLSLDTPIQYLKGVGPRRSDLFRRLGIATLRDILYHLPRRHEDRRTFLPIAQLVPGQKATIRGRVRSSAIFRAKTGTVILQVAIDDATPPPDLGPHEPAAILAVPPSAGKAGGGATGALTALWFNQPYMRRWFPVGTELILFGTVDLIGRRFQMAAPEFEVIPKEEGESPSGMAPKSLHMGRVVPIYPATSGLHQRELRTAVASALKGLLPLLTDPLPQELRQRHSLLDLPTALKRIHFPPAPEAVAAAQERLTFEELLCFQLALALRRRALQARPGISHEVQGEWVERWRNQLPFQLTAGQEKAIQEITQDMAAPRPMHRLFQGEVGSGKTVVAAYAIVVAAQNGFQSAVMAPTEVLARQHAITLSQLLGGIDLSVGLLTSSQDDSSRRQLMGDLAQGTLSVVVGTHALLEPWVKFRRLGLVVVDEQQKFGVDQRAAIVAKGSHPDLLILTATPIPRTLALTLYGEMDISTLAEQPKGRRPVKTLWMDSTRRQEVYGFIRSELEAGRQAYVVCPRIGPKEAESRLPLEDLFDGSEEVSEKAIAETGKIFREYQKAFPNFRVGLLHGRMSPAEQKAVFTTFRHQEIHLLVATQIIEVGVDIPNATVMVIEGAERFGLSQLHQLRGRVGRGEHEAACILLSDPKDPDAVERLCTLVEISDGFRIAEEDLRLRGPGQLLGKRQAGLPDLKCLQWASQGPWLEVSRAEADQLLARDPKLADPSLAMLRREVFLRFPKLTQKVAS